MTKHQCFLNLEVLLYNQRSGNNLLIDNLQCTIMPLWPEYQNCLGQVNNPMPIGTVRTSNNTAVLLTVTGQSVASSGSDEPSRVPVV